MGCGASAKRGPPAATVGLQELLRGLGVRADAKAQAALAKAGIRSRPELTRLGDKAWLDAEAALRKAGVAAEDRARIDQARQLEMLVPLGSAQVPVVLLQVGQALQTPSSMHRLFVAVGRRAGSGPSVGVQCIAFSGGSEMGRVPTEQRQCHNQNSSILHTGEQLAADATRTAAGLHDLERVYIWLPRVPSEAADCLVFIASLPGDAGGNPSWEGAYARLVNADTNQELCRLSLDAGGSEGRALVAGKLYPRRAPGRTSGPWQFLALGMPLEGDAASELQRTRCCCPPPSATAGQQRRKSDGGAPRVEVRDQLPVHVVMAADMAEATEDGMTASTRLFAFGADITRDMVLDPRFERSVDFSVLKPITEPVVGAENLLPLDLVPIVYSWIVGLDLGSSAWAAGEAVGHRGAGAVEGVSGAAGAVGGALGDSSGGAAEAVGAATGGAAGVARQPVALASTMLEAVAPAAGSVVEATSIASNATLEAMAAAASNAAEAAGGAGNAALEAGAAVASNAAEVAGGAGGTA